MTSSAEGSAEERGVDTPWLAGLGGRRSRPARNHAERNPAFKHPPHLSLFILFIPLPTVYPFSCRPMPSTQDHALSRPSSPTLVHPAASSSSSPTPPPPRPARKLTASFVLDTKVPIPPSLQRTAFITHESSPFRRRSVDPAEGGGSLPVSSWKGVGQLSQDPCTLDTSKTTTTTTRMTRLDSGWSEGRGSTASSGSEGGETDEDRDVPGQGIGFEGEAHRTRATTAAAEKLVINQIDHVDCEYT